MTFATIDPSGRYLLSDGSPSHFATHELACRCGCGANQMFQATIDMMEKIRGALKCPIYPNSGIRCWPYHTHVYELTNTARAQRGLPPTPVTVNSEHLPRNAKGEIIRTSGTQDGASMAVDFIAQAAAPALVYTICDTHAKEYGIGGLGKYPSFTHADSRNYTARWRG